MSWTVRKGRVYGDDGQAVSASRIVAEVEQLRQEIDFPPYEVAFNNVCHVAGIDAGRSLDAREEELTDIIKAAEAAGEEQIAPSAEECELMGMEGLRLLIGHDSEAAEAGEEE